MKQFVGRFFDRLVPRTMASMRELSEIREKYGSLEAALEVSRGGRVSRLEQEVLRLREEIDELRRDGRYVAELYDLVIERVRSDAQKTCRSPATWCAGCVSRRLREPERLKRKNTQSSNGQRRTDPRRLLVSTMSRYNTAVRHGLRTQRVRLRVARWLQCRVSRDGCSADQTYS
jgi:hypothetical protein